VDRLCGATKGSQREPSPPWSQHMRHDACANLLPLDHKELSVGRVVPSHVRDDGGRILVRAGETLTEEHLQNLAQPGSPALFTDRDWNAPQEPAQPPTMNPKELAAALQRRCGVRPGQGPGRRHQRHPWQCQLQITIQDSIGSRHLRRIEAETIDVSIGGFGFVSSHFIYIGTIIFARLACLPSRPVVKGIVRNCQHLEGRRHRVGVEFVPLGENERVPAM
jgi:hypothetical protein